MAQRRGQDSTRKGSLNGSESSAATSRPSARSQKTANGKTMAVGLRDRIETLAYELYLQRGRQHGYDQQDWLEAEQMALSQSLELSDEHASPPMRIPA